MSDYGFKGIELGDHQNTSIHVVCYPLISNLCSLLQRLIQRIWGMIFIPLHPLYQLRVTGLASEKTVKLY
jgi:hypothetical protein